MIQIYEKTKDWKMTIFQRVLMDLRDDGIKVTFIKIPSKNTGMRLGLGNRTQVCVSYRYHPPCGGLDGRLNEPEDKFHVQIIDDRRGELASCDSYTYEGMYNLVYMFCKTQQTIKGFSNE